MINFRPLLPSIAIPLAVWLFAGMSTASAIEPDFLMDTDPALQAPLPVRRVDPETRSLWLQALARPETDMQRMAAETIARVQEYGIPGLDEAIPLLEKNLSAKTSRQVVRFASARALIALKSRSSCDQLFEVSQSDGADFRQLVEPALADWKYEPAKKVWLDRLTAPETRVRDLVLAIRCLGQIEEPSAAGPLFNIIENPSRDAALRLEAAAAVGRMTSQGLETKAEQLVRATESTTGIDQLIAIRLLANHTSDAAKRILLGLAARKAPAVAAAALHRLNEIDPESLLPLAENAIKSEDPNVRLEGAVVYLKYPTVERITLLTPMLADAHPRVRKDIGEGLWQLTKDSQFTDPVRNTAMQVLDGDRWQGQEQAAILLGFLEHGPAANRLIELLDSPKTVVAVTAAWALRKLASPDTVPQLLEKARERTEQRQSGTQPGLDDQVAHLFEALGVMQVTDAAPLLMQYFPKHPAMGVRSRAAAIWAIGRIHEGKRNSEVEDALTSRITDFADKPPELSTVKEMSAIALARMKAVDQAGMMSSLVKSTPLPVRLGLALRWAIKELVDEELPPPEAVPFREDDWFLQSIHN